jgi:hypothetical protein
MAKIITGDTTKGIKSVGELALRISRFDSYRLFTLYENVKEGKIMNVSGNQKYYLVFKSPNKEIRIPEYDPKGFFEVDKVNGCILFKITKKNAEDILSMKTAGERIFYIIRVFFSQNLYGWDSLSLRKSYAGFFFILQGVVLCLPKVPLAILSTATGLFSKSVIFSILLVLWRLLLCWSWAVPVLPLRRWKATKLFPGKS